MGQTKSNDLTPYFPLLVLFGLLLGLFFDLPLHQPVLSHWIWFATLLLGGIPIIFQTFRGMLHGAFASDIVASLAIITALFMDQAFAGAIVVLMQSGGEALERYGLRRATSSLKALLARAPRFAFRKKDGTLEKIKVEQIQVGDLLMVRTGDLIPVDGTITNGSSEIDESALTGEPLAHAKGAGESVFSGSVDVNGTFEMRADKTSQESQYQKIVELVQKAQSMKAPIQRLADRYAIFFTPLTLLMAAIGYFLTADTLTILSVLVVATPCPLILATPLAILCGINKSARTGIIVKGGAAMEQIGKIQAAVFDKTGTITFGTPYVEEVIPFEPLSEEELLHQVASIEQLSTHSIAKAIVEKTHQKLAIPSDFKETPGRGVEAALGKDHFVIGSYPFLKERLGDFVKNQPNIAPFLEREQLPIFIAKNGVCIGLLLISDRIRPQVAELMQDLKTLGIQETLMLTGDHEKNAALIAKQAGIKNYQANLLPQEKVEAIENLKKKYHHIAMIGDGINDAPALATATVGVAMGAYGTAISAEAADIVFLIDDLGKLKEVIRLSQWTLHIAKESIWIGIGLSFILMVIAAFGVIPPAIGALLQEIIDVAVILNALRAG